MNWAICWVWKIHGINHEDLIQFEEHHISSYCYDITFLIFSYVLLYVLIVSTAFPHKASSGYHVDKCGPVRRIKAGSQQEFDAVTLCSEHIWILTGQSSHKGLERAK